MEQQGSLSDLVIRLMFHRDLPQVLAIERRKARGAWTEEDFRPVFQAPDTDGWVAEVDDHIVGFIVFQTLTHTPGPLCISLLNLAVAPYWRRSRIGKAMLAKLAQRVRGPGECIRVTVPESSLPLQLFLREVGFEAVRVLRRHFRGEDAYVLEYQSR